MARESLTDHLTGAVVPERLCMTDAPSHLDSCITEVWELLERIGQETTDSPGITRAAWSAAMFVRAGIPSAVILVRNANGSHNSDEALDREDFAGGVHVLGRAMHRLANAR